MKEIELTRGKVALVDDRDYEWLSQWSWRALKAERKKMSTSWYAIRNTPRPNRTTVYMHRAIWDRHNGPSPLQCDHIDWNGLNNQLLNLRLATASQNRWNMRRRIGQSSKFKGVSWDKKISKWMARIYFKNKQRYLGVFDNEAEAAKAYDAVARREFGQFAFLNFT